MELEKMSANEARNIIPNVDHYTDAVDLLVAKGWKFVGDKSGRWAYGWWINANHETKCRPNGDAQSFHLAAWNTFKTYVAVERI